MSYVIYNTETGKRYSKTSGRSSYKTERGAKIARSKAIKSNGNNCRLAVVTEEWWEENVNYEVERVNLMSGEKYMEKRFTPVHMSPACETYWSM